METDDSALFVVVHVKQLTEYFPSVETIPGNKNILSGKLGIHIRFGIIGRQLRRVGKGELVLHQTAQRECNFGHTILGQLFNGVV